MQQDEGGDGDEKKKRKKELKKKIKNENSKPETVFSQNAADSS